MSSGYISTSMYNDYNIEKSLYINTEYNKLLVGESLKLDIVGASNIDVILDVCRKRVTDSYSTSDMVIDTATAQLNNYGVYTVAWSSPNGVITGYDFHYYPRVRLGTSPASTARLGNTVVIYDRLQSIIAHLDNALGDVQTIPVYDELSKDSINGGTSFRFTYKHWNPDFPVLTIKDGVVLTASEIAGIDYEEGIIHTTANVSSTEELNSSYVFKFFSNYDLRLFVERAVSSLNMLSPVTNFNYASFPDYWYDIVIMEATLRALDSLFASSMFREKQVIFGDKDVTTALASYYSRLMSATDVAKTKVKKIHDALPAAISGMDIVAPPRITGSNFRTWIGLRGKAL